MSRPQLRFAPERNFIRFAGAHSPDADERAEAAEREVLKREYLISQGRADFYEARQD